jgi:hypothetical protein
MARLVNESESALRRPADDMSAVLHVVIIVRLRCTTAFVARTVEILALLVGPFFEYLKEAFSPDRRGRKLGNQLAHVVPFIERLHAFCLKGTDTDLVHSLYNAAFLCLTSCRLSTHERVFQKLCAISFHRVAMAYISLLALFLTATNLVSPSAVGIVPVFLS